MRIGGRHKRLRESRSEAYVPCASEFASLDGCWCADGCDQRMKGGSVEFALGWLIVWLVDLCFFSFREAWAESGWLNARRS